MSVDLRLTLAVAISHVQSWLYRMDMAFRAMAAPVDRRVDPSDVCPLCGHQLGAEERRPPRDTRTLKGTVKRLPAEVLVWRRCGGCGRHTSTANPYPHPREAWRDTDER